MRRMMWVWMAALLLLPGSGLVSGQSAGARRGGGAATSPPAPRGGAASTPATARTPGAGPIVVIETAKGTIQIETYPKDAPKTVEHILGLVKRNFYNGLRVHRVEPGFVVQFGDPLSRDMTKRDLWGTGDSGKSIGVSEKKRLHALGAVAVAHAGDPRGADSQMYITLAPQPRLDRLEFTVFGQVISGMDVVRKLQVNDVLRKVTVKN